MFSLAATEEKKGEKAMTYHELVEKVRIALVVKTDASKIEEHIAAQVNVQGEAEGAFYIEIKDGELVVKPFDYNDRDFLLTCDGEEILAVAQGKKTLEAAITEGVITHEGNWDKTLVLSNIIPSAEEPKAEAPAEEEKPKKKPGRKPKAEAEQSAEETPAEGQLAFGEEVPAEEVKAEETPVPTVEEVKAEETPASKKKSGRKPRTETAKKTTKKTTKKTDK
ncbi:MAG: SCP2 sterol-binding domain-containing protein [Ruminococcus sp.]|nr:SCP2 sterol-binding domain-containing protein [Ruminococcus sp.]